MKVRKGCPDPWGRGNSSHWTSAGERDRPTGVKANQGLGHLHIRNNLICFVLFKVRAHSSVASRFLSNVDYTCLTVGAISRLPIPDEMELNPCFAV